jgi:hypothetical protein
MHQNEDGGWTIPEGAEGISGARLTGFAHGVAGMVCFLCEYSCRSNNPEAMRAARRGAEWLLRHSRASPEGKVLHWTTRDGGKDVWHWWCHGAPSIALAWLKLFEQSGETADRTRPSTLLLSGCCYILLPCSLFWRVRYSSYFGLVWWATEW